MVVFGMKKIMLGNLILLAFTLVCYKKGEKNKGCHPYAEMPSSAQNIMTCDFPSFALLSILLELSPFKRKMRGDVFSSAHAKKF